MEFSKNNTPPDVGPALARIGAGPMLSPSHAGIATVITRWSWVTGPTRHTRDRRTARRSQPLPFTARDSRICAGHALGPGPVRPAYGRDSAGGLLAVVRASQPDLPRILAYGRSCVARPGRLRFPI